METFVGTILLVAFDFEPENFMRCDGRLLEIRSNVFLFSLIGTKFGGDGSKTFGLPNLESPVPGLQFIICVNGLVPGRQ